MSRDGRKEQEKRIEFRRNGIMVGKNIRKKLSTPDRFVGKE